MQQAAEGAMEAGSRERHVSYAVLDLEQEHAGLGQDGGPADGGGDAVPLMADAPGGAPAAGAAGLSRKQTKMQAKSSVAVRKVRAAPLLAGVWGGRVACSLCPQAGRCVGWCKVGLHCSAQWPSTPDSLAPGRPLVARAVDRD